jgi:hypothetical protein
MYDLMLHWSRINFVCTFVHSFVGLVLPVIYEFNGDHLGIWEDLEIELQLPTQLQ